MPGKNHLENIFEEMSYNTSTQDEDIAFTAWLPNNTISSIVDGKWKSSTTSDSIISIKNSALKVALIGSSPECISKLGLTSKDDVSIETNLSKFKDRDLLISLCLNVPLWQVTENSKLGTTTTPIDLNIFNVEEDCGVLLQVDLSSKTFSLEAISALIKSIASYKSKKFVFAIRITSEKDALRLLPIVYDICHLNVGLKDCPVDVLLFKDITEDTKRSLCNQHGSLTRLQNINCTDLSQKNIAIVSGGFSKRSFGHANHFIVDSSADLQNAVEAIGQKVWLTSLESEKLHRSLLFVHQPDYKTLVDSLELKLNSLRITENWKKDSDFIKMTSQVDNIVLPGVKRLPPNGDLRGPTVIYDIGTSSDLVASTSKNTGLGYLLIVLPYRSNTELISLANNHGSHNDVFLFSNNITNIKDICKNIKGQTIKVNTCMKKLSTNPAFSNVWGTFTSLQVKDDSKELSKKIVEELDKKAESSKSKILLSRPVSEINSDSENFIIRVTKPIGLCGIVLVNPVVLDSETIIGLLSNITSAGNTIIVICVGSKLSDGILQKCSSQFSGFFLESVAESADEALKLLAISGKIDFALVYHNNYGVSLENCTSFNNFIVTVNGKIDSELLMTKKVVYM